MDILHSMFHSHFIRSEKYLSLIKQQITCTDQQQAELKSAIEFVLDKTKLSKNSIDVYITRFTQYVHSKDLLNIQAKADKKEQREAFIHYKIASIFNECRVLFLSSETSQVSVDMLIAKLHCIPYEIKYPYTYALIYAEIKSDPYYQKISSASSQYFQLFSKENEKVLQGIEAKAEKKQDIKILMILIKDYLIGKREIHYLHPVKIDHAIDDVSKAGACRLM